MTTEREFLYRKGKQADGTHRYVYFRHPVTKELTKLPSDETSQAFEDQYGPLYRAVKGANDPAPATASDQPRVVLVREFRQGTIGYFLTEYKNHNTFKTMSDNSRRNTGRDIDNMRKHAIAQAMLHDLTPAYVDVYTTEIAAAFSTSTADKHATLLSNLWQFARRYECFKRGDKHNPTIGRLRHHTSTEEHLAWPADVIDAFDCRAISNRPDLYRYRMGLHYTGQRGGDVLNMRWDDYQRGAIYVVQEKTGAKIWVACPKPLAKLLDSMPRVSEFIFTNSRGKQYGSAHELSVALRTLLRKCGYSKPGDEATYSMHGLRKNAGVELALAGCSVQEIMAVLGHETPKMAIYYCRQADKLRLAASAAAKWSDYADQEASRKAAEREQAAQTRRQQLKAI